MHIIDLHRRALDAIRPIVARVRPADLGRPTPCPGWDLRALLSHMIGQDHGFAAAVLADVSAEAFAPRTPTIEAHEAGAAAVVAAFAAADPTRQVLLAELGGRRFPLPSVIGFHLLDTLVHGWDVAVSLDTSVDYDDDLLAVAQAQAELVPAPPRSAPSCRPRTSPPPGHAAWPYWAAIHTGQRSVHHRHVLQRGVEPFDREDHAHQS